MAKRLDDTSRNILAYRPKIDFVEPEVEPGEITPIEVPVQLEEVADERKKVRQLAKAVNALATALQARVDEKAKGLVIKLDPKVDAQAVMAMRRMFPGADPTRITFDQYKKCKEDMRKKGEEIGKKATITPEQVEKAIQDMATAAAGGAGVGGTFNQLGGFNTPDALNGGLRPELNKNAQIIEPLDIDEFQDIMMKILVNFLWKNFIKPVIPLPPGVPGLPDKLCSVDQGMVSLLSAQGINMETAGEKPPKKQEEPEIPTGTPEGL